MRLASLERWFSGEPLQRIRFLFLSLSVLAMMISPFRLRAADSSAELKLASICATLLLAGWWVIGYRRQSFPLLAVPLEAALLVVASLAFGGPLPMYGILYVTAGFRALYGEGYEGLLPTAAWIAAMVVSFAITGSFTIQGLGISGLQTPGIVIGGLIMWLLSWSLKERERWFVRERELLHEREQDAEEKAHALAGVNILKDRLIERLSHELRTPLTSVRSYSELLLDYPDPSVQHEFVSIIHSESERLHRLLNDVLDLAKIQSGTFTFRMAEMDVADLLHDVEHNYRPLIERQGLEFGLDIDPDLKCIEGDRDRLLQVMINLLNNALKFTDRGSIIIGAHQVAEGVEISVADSGIGVPEHEREQIFERFHQASPAAADKPQGTGLGLAICREIAERHGGRMAVADRPGGGSIFTLELPLSAPSPAQLAESSVR